MPVFDALGRTYDVRVVDSNGTVMTEYMDDTGRTWIIARPGDSFKVTSRCVASKLTGRKKYELHAAELALDGHNVHDFGCLNNIC